MQQKKKLITLYQAFIHIVCPWSKYCSARSEVSAAILKLVFTVDIMLWTTSQLTLFRHFPILSRLSKPLHFGVQAFLVNLLLEEHKKTSTRCNFGTARGSISLVGLKMGVSALVYFPHTLFCLCSSPGLNSRRLISSCVLKIASLAILPTKGPVSIHTVYLYSHCGDSLLVTDGLGELVIFFSGIFAAHHPLSAS